MNPVVKFFDKLEDRVRGFLSRRAIGYAFLTGIGIVLFWRGVWHSMDLLMQLYSSWTPGVGIDLQGAIWWDGPLSFLIGAIVLLISGTFVSEFIGNEIIISGLRGEKKLTEKTETEVETESVAIAQIMEQVKAIREEVTKNRPQ